MNILKNKLSIYLPYSLKLERINYKHERFKILTPYDLLEDGEIENIIPILKPLSSLTKEELQNQGFWHHIDWLTDGLQEGLKKEGNVALQKYIGDAPFEMVQYLISNHYDILGLIDLGIAKSYYLVESEIDLNTLKTK